MAGDWWLPVVYNGRQVQRVIYLAMALLTGAWLAPAATPAKHKTSKRRHSATHPKTTLSRSKAATTPKGLSAKRHSKTRSKKTTRHTARSYQQHPTQERYKEIQDALVSKGYFHGEANGEWGPDSVDALKRFQADQNLMPDGKISSLSLIALGLGPKRLTAARTTDSAPHTPGTEATPAASQ